MEDVEIKVTISELVTDLTKEGVQYFQKSIDKAGLNLTGELRNSIDYTIREEIGSLSLTAEILFKGYGRFKDMKRLRYSEFPNIEAIEAYVEKIGVESFAWVNGYEGKQIPNVKMATKRIAWALLMHRKKVPVVVQNDKRTWYNKVKMAYINVMSRRLSLRLAEILPTYLKKGIEA